MILSCVFSSKKKKYTTVVWSNMTKLYKAESFASSMKFAFEGEHFCGPVGYDEYLTISYGNYMELPPESKRVTHSPGIVSFEKNYSEFLE